MNPKAVPTGKKSLILLTGEPKPEPVQVCRQCNKLADHLHYGVCDTCIGGAWMFDEFQNLNSYDAIGFELRKKLELEKFPSPSQAFQRGMNIMQQHLTMKKYTCCVKA